MDIHQDLIRFDITFEPGHPCDCGHPASSHYRKQGEGGLWRIFCKDCEDK